MRGVPRESPSYHSQMRQLGQLMVGTTKQRNRSNALVGSFRVQSPELTKKKTNHLFQRPSLLQRNPAIAHFKGLTDFMPYCGNALLPMATFLRKNKNGVGVRGTVFHEDDAAPILF